MSFETPAIEEDINEPEEQDNIKHKQIAELEAPMKVIIEKIKDGVEGGEYGLIIGDDASGRIPALILGNFIKEVAERNGVEQPNIIFIPGKLENSAKEYIDVLDEHLKKWGASRDKKILLVTDTVKSGQSLEVIVKFIKQLGYDCEIATIGLESPITGFVERKINLGRTKIISGKMKNTQDPKNHHTPSVYGNVSSGVRKDPGDWVSYKKDFDGFDSVRDVINESRVDSKVLTRKLIDWYELQK